MAMRILRLDFGTLRGVDGRDWPVHGFAIAHPRAGVILVDTGAGGPDEVLADWRVVGRTVDTALADHGLAVADVRMVVNTHLHFDHCGQNAVFAHAPVVVQRLELERARRESSWLRDWYDAAGTRFELQDGDAELAEGVRLLSTPGHTVGHQCVAVSLDSGLELIIGDAAYTADTWRNPDRPLVEGQAADPVRWRESLDRLRSLAPRRVHLCHDTTPV